MGALRGGRLCRGRSRGAAAQGARHGFDRDAQRRAKAGARGKARGVRAAQGQPDRGADPSFGSARNDGAILIIAKNDHAFQNSIRIEVGRGLEGAIPDAIAKRIGSDVIAPYFRANDFYGGIVAGTEAVMKVIDGEPLPAPKARGRTQSSGEGYGELFITLV